MSGGRILRIELPLEDEFRLPMPPGPILAVQVQRGAPCLWMRGDPQADWDGGRRFCGVSTGLAVPNGARHVGTVQLDGGYPVLQLFEEHAECGT